MGYPGIFLLMPWKLDFPVPTRVGFMASAGYLAQQRKDERRICVFWGTVGSLAGAYANYFAAHYLGRPLVLRYGRLLGTPSIRSQSRTLLSRARRDLDLRRELFPSFVT